MNDTLVALDRHRTAPASRGRIRRVVRLAARGLPYCAVLIPVGVASAVAAPLGGGGMAAAWWRRLRTGLLGMPPLAPERPGGVRVLGHAVGSVLLGVAAVPALGTVVLFLARGVLYGLVDRGPYTTSWGGPTEAGAWIAHFLIGVPMALAALAALAGIASVHQRLTGALDRARLAAWVVPVTLVLAVPAVGFIVLWTHQL